MNRNSIYSLFFIGLMVSIFVLQSCNLDTCKDSTTYVKYDPIYMKLEDFRKDVVASTPRALTQPGKMYFFHNYLLINEKEKGIHVIDNSNPENPKPVAFWEIPGNVDMAVRNDILYADSYSDLIAVDIKNILQPKQLERRQGAFLGFQIEANKGIVIGYEKTNETVILDCNNINYGYSHFKSGESIFSSDVSNSTGFSPQGVPVKQTAAPSIGIQGSQSRFTMYDKYLYTVNQGRMNVYDVSVRLVEKQTIPTWWNTETIFAYNKALYIGTPNGFIIFDNANPESPKQAAMVQHITGCDPVFVEGNKAYVTIRTGTTCNGTANLLEVYNIENIYAPNRISQFNMDNPHGLSIEGNNLYLCEGKFGLKVFDRSDDINIDRNQIAQFKDFFAYDVIALPENYPVQNKKIVMVIGDDGLVQFDATDNKNLKKLSTIKVLK
jgi:hypothetical protein